jgi:hypothetical protein
MVLQVEACRNHNHNHRTYAGSLLRPPRRLPPSAPRPSRPSRSFPLFPLLPLFPLFPLFPCRSLPLHVASYEAFLAPSQAVSLHNPVLAATLGALTGVGTLTAAFTLMKVRLCL